MLLSRWKSVVASFTLIFVLAGSPVPTAVHADEKPAESTVKKAGKAPAGRVPNHFGKLNLSQKQKEEIYAIQGKYREQETALEKQLQELEAARDKEVHNVLTSTQKSELARIEAEAAAKKKAAKTTSE